MASFDGEAFLELLDLVYSGPELIETDEQEALLVLEFVAFLVGDLDIVLDEAEKVARRLMESATLTSTQSFSESINGEVDEDERLYDQLTISTKVERVGELGSDGAAGIGRPIAWCLSSAIDVDGVHDGRVQ